MLLLVKLQALAWNFTKSNTPSRVSFTFFKLCKRYQIAPTHHSDQEQQLTRLLSGKSTAINDWAFWTKTVTNLKFSCLETDAMLFFLSYLLQCERWSLSGITRPRNHEKSQKNLARQSDSFTEIFQKLFLPG